MKASNISFIRMQCQHLGSTVISNPKSLASWMGAMQAQDFPMAEWALGIRLPGSKVEQIEKSINEGEILRTHLLRPTWHFTTPEDIGWLLDLSSPQIKASQRSRDRDLELFEPVYSLSNTTIQKSLGDRGQLSREELIGELNNIGIATNQNRASHLLMRAELEKIICSGSIQHGKPTYALLSERAKHPRKLAKDEALAELATRYFTSRSPATLQDFIWWSGLQVSDARQALETVKSSFIQETIQGKIYWLPGDFTYTTSDRDKVFLLPTYDELIVSYTDRSATIPIELEEHMKEISNRGVFWPIIVLGGQVTGTWKRTVKKNDLIVEIQLFSHPGQAQLKQIEEAADKYSVFLYKRVELIFPHQVT